MSIQTLKAFHVKTIKTDGKGYRVTVAIDDDFVGDKASYVEEEINRQLVGQDSIPDSTKAEILADGIAYFN